MKERFIELEQVHNFRDMGQLPTLCNGVVRSGCLYRSARLSDISDNDIKLLNDLNIKVILDYRFYDEMLDNPNKPIKDVNMNVIPAFKVRKDHSAVAFEDFFKEGGIEFFENSLLDEYTQLPFDNPAYKFLFNEINKCEDRSILHHCTVGRDRTGVASALVLKLLNVDEKLIMEDYLLSNEALVEFFKTMHDDFDISEDKKANLYDIMKIKEIYLNSIYDLILDKYQTFENYFLNEYHLSEEDIKRIRAFYINY